MSILGYFCQAKSTLSSVFLFFLPFSFFHGALLYSFFGMSLFFLFFSVTQSKEPNFLNFHHFIFSFNFTQYRTTCDSSMYMSKNIVL